MLTSLFALGELFMDNASHHTVKKINVGCGFDHRPGYINVDMDPACNPDILIADNNFSNLPRQAYDEVLAKDVMEHIMRVETPGAVLEWADLLKIGGMLEIQTSNVFGVVKMMEENWNYRAHAHCSIYMFGNQAHAGDFHHTGFTELTLKTQILSAGFEIVEMELRDQWLFWLRAKKIWDWTALERTGENLSNRDFVRSAYLEILAREPEEDAQALLTAWLDDGKKTRREILKHLASSPERLEKTADDRLSSTRPVLVIAPSGRLQAYPRLQRFVAILRRRRLIWF